MKRILIISAMALLCMLLLCACAVPAAQPVQTAVPSVYPTILPEPTPVPYQGISAQALYALLQEDPSAVLLIDLQPEAYYAKTGHLQNAVATEAYPANNEALHAKLAATLEDAKAAKNVVLIDMAGKIGVHNAFDYYAESGVDGEKLHILDGGMMAWPYEELVEITPEAYEVQSIAAMDVRKAFRRGEAQILLDLRSNEAYTLSHIKESINIPAESDETLANALPLLAQDPLSPIILVTADGGEDARAYYDYFARHAVLPARLYVLKGGIAAWPKSYAHYLVEAETPAAKGFEKVETTESPVIVEQASPEPSPEEMQYFG